MKNRIAALLLAFCLTLALLPGTARAAGTLPDWYFLFAIFKNIDADCRDYNGVMKHTKYRMSQDEINVARGYAKEFEAYMNQLGVVRAHVDVVEIDAALTKLEDLPDGSYISAKQAAPLLKGKVNLDQYDHVTCIACLNVPTNYGGITGAAFENGTGQSCINFVDRDTCLNTWAVGVYPWAPGYPVHEFLHFMEVMSRKWGGEFGLHDIMENFYERVNGEYEACYTDILLNRARGTAGTGVSPLVWQYPPHVLRTMRELTIPDTVAAIPQSAFANSAKLESLTIPSGVASIGQWSFQDCAALSKVNIHSGVTEIGPAAFERCTALTELTIPSSVTSIGVWAFQGCTALTKISIPASVTSIGEVAFYNTGLKNVYYGGTEAQWKAIQIGGFNDLLANATIHYNSVLPSEKKTCTVTFNPNSGTTTTKSKTVTTGSTYGTLPTPTRTGYKFNGWYTAKTGGTKITSATKVTKTANHTLYARWTKRNFSVTLNPNSGTILTDSVTVTLGTRYRHLPTPVRASYHFDGWYTAKSGGTKVTESTQVKSGVTALYAHWTKTNPTVKERKTASYQIIIPEDYKVLLYSSETAATVAKNAAAQTSDYTVTCTKMVKLSNGTVRYYGIFPKVSKTASYWFTYTDEMFIN